MTEASEQQPDRYHAWLIASRPHTLPAGAAPVLLGSAIAWWAGVFAVLPALSALIGALLLQIGVNFANDYYDALKGVDTEDRTGFTRVTQAGLLTKEEIRTGMWVIFGLALLPGGYLVYLGGLPILAVGLTGVFFALTYSGGPLPLGSIGLGDLLVFLYFGIIAVTGTYFVQAIFVIGEIFPVWPPPETVPIETVIASLAPAALSTAILAVNNIRDIPTDREAGKFTLAVLLGHTGARLEYTLLVLCSYAVPVYFLFLNGFNVPFLLPFLTLPPALSCIQNVWTSTNGDVLNDTLSRTGKVLFIHSLLFSAGFLLG